MNEWSDVAIATGIVFMLRIFLGLLGFIAIAAVVQYVREHIRRIDASRPTPRARRKEFRGAERNARGRKAMATDLQPRFPQVSALDHDALERKAAQQ